MKTTLMVVTAVLAGLQAPARAEELLYANPGNSNWTTIPSAVWSNPPANEEAADDFDVVGTIERVIIGGDNACLVVCLPPPVVGVTMRFYEWTASGPGAVQYEAFIDGGDPNVLYDAGGPDLLDVTLPTPFEATGQHFISAQLIFEDGFYWSVWVSNYNNPTGSHLWYRDNLDGGLWQPYIDVLQNPVISDMVFSLYGTPPDAEPPALVDDCGQWNPVETPNPPGAIDARLQAVEVIAPWDVWAVGNYSAQVLSGYDQFTLAMHYNGTTWSIVPSPSPTPAEGLTHCDLRAVAAAAPNDVWAVGHKNFTGQGGYVGTRVLALRWNGSAWSEVPLPVPTQASSPFQGASGDSLQDLAVIAPNDLWLVGKWYRFLPSDAVVWPGVALHWNGSDFEVFEPPLVSPTANQQLSAVAAVSSDDVWAVGSGGGDVSYIFHWDGSGWSHVPGPAPGTSNALSDVVALAADDIWAGGYYSDPGGSAPLLVHWDGSGWTQVATPAGGDDFAAFGPDHILTRGIGGLASWDGQSWTLQPDVAYVPWAGVFDMEPISPCEVWGVGMKSVGGDYRTFAVALESVGTPGDADGDGLADTEDNCPNLFNPDQADCDGQGMGDACALASGQAQDCNGNFLPDPCDTFVDCNANDVPDECEPDCQGNGIADACDISGGGSPDCDANGVPDECDTFDDCNTNGISDGCDVAAGASTDGNANGVPDECEALGEDIAAVTTVDDIVDFGGGQRMADLPGPDGRISFREACLAVNNTPGPQTIAFNIPQSDWWLFNDRAILRQEDGIFALNDDETLVDFSTQTAFTGDTNPDGGEVGIYGLEPNAWGVAAIYVNGNHCTIKGLDRVMQRGYGVRLVGNDNHVIGCTISGPLYAGVYITGGFGGDPATGNIVGGTAAGDGNFLSSGNDGVRIDGPAADNVVIGNVLTGSFSGAAVRGQALGTRIGGPTPEERNIISGAGHYGEEGFPDGQQVNVNGAVGTLIEGNYIGTTADGLASEGQIGSAGIVVWASSGTVIRGNLIGGIAVDGVDHYAGQRFGTGILVTQASDQTVIVGNRLGSDASGEGAIPNHVNISVAPFTAPDDPTSTTIGGTEPGDANLIVFSELHGIGVSSVVSGVTISGNSIHSNTTLGIDLFAPAGTNANDPGDADAGGNDLQNFPVLIEAYSTASATHIAGALDSLPNSGFAVEFFVSDSCDDSGFGEGQSYLGSAVVQTDTDGHADFDVAVPVAAGAGAAVTATATEVVSGNTSEFSACVTAESGAGLSDMNGDGFVDAADLALLLGMWGPCPDCPADLNGDSLVDAVDLAMVLGEWSGAGQ